MKAVLPLLSAFLGRFVSAAGVLAISIVLSRQLSLEEAGRFFAAFTTVMGMAIFLQGGQQVLLIRRAAMPAEDGQTRPAMFARSFATVAALCGIVALGWAIASYFWGAPAAPIANLWTALVPVTLIGQSAAYLKGVGKPGLGGLWEVGLISAVATASFMLAPPDSALAAWDRFAVISWAMLAISLVVVLRQDRVRLSDFWPQLALLGEGRHLWGVSVLSYLGQWGGVLIVAAMSGQEAVAILNALLRMMAPLQFVMLTLDYYLAPKFASAPVSRVRRLRRWGAFVGVAVAAPYTMLLFTVPDLVMTQLFGTGYGGYGAELRILLIFWALTLAMGANGILLNMRGQDYVALKSVVARSSIAMVLTACLTPAFGLTAAVIGFAAGLLVQNLYCRSAVARLILTSG